MDKVKVGSIEGHDVLYLPERDLVFCKNTVLPYNIAREVLKTSLDRIVVEDKKLVIRIYSTTIELGCLTTSKENYKQIYKTIQKIKHNESK